MTSGVTESFALERRVVTATFATQGGATLALKRLEELEKQGILDVENTLTVDKSAWDTINVHQTTAGSAGHGAKVGAIVGAVAGLIFPPSILATTALGAAVGGMTGAMRGSIFDETEIKAVADSLEPGQSMLVAVVEPKDQAEVQEVLSQVALKTGWATLTEAQMKALEAQGK